MSPTKFNRTLTIDNKKESQRLKAIWNSKRHELKLTQTEVAEKLKTTQGFIGQCLNGHVALSTNMILRWAALLDFDPEDIRKGIFQGVDTKRKRVQVMLSTNPNVDHANRPIELPDEDNVVAIHVADHVFAPRVYVNEYILLSQRNPSLNQEVVVRTHNNYWHLGLLSAKQKTQIKVLTAHGEQTIKDVDIDFCYPVQGILK